jgi:NADH:ubiquinone oxidoreductase subunit 2 (subunit N)
MTMEQIYLAIPLAPLLGAVIAGLFGRYIGRAGAHTVAILGVGISCVLSLYVLQQFISGAAQPFNGTVYTWMVSGGVHFEVGFLIDRLTVLMMSVVSFVSLMVHIYTIGYMHDDPGYKRFFSYIALFTFSMLMLVMSNNFLQLFFGWEAVGLVSYLLIGFWYTRPSAIFANLKAFLVNRVGDFGFLLGIAAIYSSIGSLDYATVFAAAPAQADALIQVIPGHDWSLMSVICILLFVGAMGKSAQVPLHVWLPDSMEGPTPISALIHAATMVTAGIFMVARMSPLFELSETALTFVMVIGAITALFMGILGVVQNDIKRVIAYSTLSQLGYMTVARGLRLCRRYLPPDDARLLQGAAVPGGRFGHHRHAPRPGHPQHGRAAQVHAGDLDHLADRFAGADRYAVLFRVLFQGHDHRGGARLARRGQRFCLLGRAAGRVRHGAVHLPHVLPGVPRRAAHGCPYPRTPARDPAGGDRAAGDAGDTLRGGRLPDRSGGVRQLVRRGDPRGGAARGTEGNR